MKPPDKPRPPVAADDSLLDPESFWESEAEAPGQRESSREDSDVAEITAPPVSAPDELFIPKKEREAAPSVPIRRGPAPPRPQADFITRPPKVPTGRLAMIIVGIVVVLGVLGVLAWISLSGRDDPQEDRPGPAPESGFGRGEPTTAPAQQPVESPRETSPAKTGPTPRGAKTGTLKLTSDPPGAVVFVNDERSGATPTTIRGIAAGSQVDIRIETEGFNPWRQSVVFEGKDLHREFHAGLQKADDCQGGSGWVYVNSTPSGATVELDEKRLPGKTPMVIDSVCAGESHEIRVQALGFHAWRHSFNLTAGQVYNLNVDLKK